MSAMELDHDADLVVESQDYVLSEGEQSNYAKKAGNKTVGSLVEKLALSYFTAATADERSTIVAQIEAQARATKGSNGSPLRFLVAKKGHESGKVFREATPEEIKLEIENLMQSKFISEAENGDVLIYTGESLRNQSHIGNQRLHTFIRSLGRVFPSAGQRRGLVNVARDVVTLRGSDFLIQLNENRPEDGYVKADDESIERMLALLLE